MSYAFNRNEDIATSIRKAIGSSLNEAIQSLPISKGIHKEQFKKARKAVKRARAAIRLFEHGLKGNWVDREEDILRSVSRVFRDVRDMSVAEEVFDKVLKVSKDKHPVATFDSVRRHLSKVCKETEENTLKEEKRLRTAIADLQIAAERVDEIKVKGDSWSHVFEGLRDTYRDCCDAFENTEASRSDGAYIDWRRAVKFLRLQLDFLAEFLTSEMKAFNSNLHPLSDLLGEYQDILLIQETIKEDKSAYGEKETVRAVLDMLEDRMKHIGKEARKLGEDFFDLTPKDFMKTVFDESKKPKKTEVA